jgi:hypothetical protein
MPIIGIPGIKRKNSNSIEINQIKFQFGNKTYPFPKVIKQKSKKRKEKEEVPVVNVNSVVKEIERNFIPKVNAPVIPSPLVLPTPAIPAVPALKPSISLSMDEDDNILRDLENFDDLDDISGDFFDEENAKKSQSKELKEEKMEIEEPVMEINPKIEVIIKTEEKVEVKLESKIEISFDGYQKKYEEIDFSNPSNGSRLNAIPYFNNQTFFKDGKELSRNSLPTWRPKNETQTIKKKKKDGEYFSKELSFYLNILGGEGDENLLLFLMNNMEEESQEIESDPITFKDIFTILSYVISVLKPSLDSESHLKFDLDKSQGLDIPQLRVGLGEHTWVDSKPNLMNYWSAFGFSTYGKPKTIYIDLIIQKKQFRSQSELKLFLKDFQSNFSTHQLGNLIFKKIHFMHVTEAKESKESESLEGVESTRDEIEIILQKDLENNQLENDACHLVLDLTNSFFSNKFNIHHIDKKDNIVDLIFEIYDKSVRKQHEYSNIYYEPAFCLTEKQHST